MVFEFKSLSASQSSAACPGGVYSSFYKKGQIGERGYGYTPSLRALTRTPLATPGEN